MCNSKDKVMIWYPFVPQRHWKKVFPADRCMVPILRRMWREGIRTEMHCCAHRDPREKFWQTEWHMRHPRSKKPYANYPDRPYDRPWVEIVPTEANIRKAERYGYKVAIMTHRYRKEYVLIAATVYFGPWPLPKSIRKKSRRKIPRRRRRD